MDKGETDGLLVAGVRRGDPKAFDQLVRRHLRTAHAVARSRLSNPADADDVCQEAFIKALQNIDDCREPERFRAWLLTIVRNTAHNRRAYNQIRDTAPLESANDARSVHDPARDLSRSELATQLNEAMQHLTELQRRVLILHDREGWKHSEIADELGISSGSSRVHLHVARKSMKKRLERFALGALV